MSPRSLLVVVVALVFGGSAAIGVNSLISSASGPRAKWRQWLWPPEVLRGGMLTADMVKVHDFPKHLVPQGAINKVEDASIAPFSSPIMKDDPVSRSKLAPKGSGRGCPHCLQGDAGLYDPDAKYRLRRRRVYFARQQGRRPIDRG